MREEGGENDRTATRARSFRNEDYNTRRAFLRSYPLQWGDEEEEERDPAAGGEEKKVKYETTVVAAEENVVSGGGEAASECKSCIKRIVMAAFQWRGEKRGLVLRKFKHKFSVYFVACSCIPVGFKAPDHSFISAHYFL